MQPTSPVLPGYSLSEIIYAENQPQYQNLPSFRTEDGDVLTRWKLTLRERIKIFFTGSIYLTISTFNHPLQPVMLQVDKPILHEANDEIEQGDIDL